MKWDHTTYWDSTCCGTQSQFSPLFTLESKFLSLIEELAKNTDNKKAFILSETLNSANGKFLTSGKSPSRKVNELDTRGSHFYLTMYWVEALASQTKNSELQIKFTAIKEMLLKNETKILNDLNVAQGKPVNLGGYYMPDNKKMINAMRPSNTFNKIIDSIM